MRVKSLVLPGLQGLYDLIPARHQNLIFQHTILLSMPQTCQACYSHTLHWSLCKPSFSHQLHFNSNVTTLWEWAVSLGHLLSRRWSPQSLCRAITLCGNIFPCFRFHVSTCAPFFLLKHVRGDTSPMYYGICPLCGRGLSPVTATQEGFMQDN